MLSRLAVGVRVDQSSEMVRHNGRSTSRKEDQEETRHRVVACVPSEYS